MSKILPLLETLHLLLSIEEKTYGRMCPYDTDALASS